MQIALYRTPSIHTHNSIIHIRFIELQTYIGVLILRFRCRRVTVDIGARAAKVVRGICLSINSANEHFHVLMANIARLPISLDKLDKDS